MRLIRPLFRQTVLHIQQERPRFLFWLPVFQAIGIGSYFVLNHEPSWLAALALCAVLGAGTLWLRYGRLPRKIDPKREPLWLMSLMLLAISIGFAGITLRTQTLDTVQIDKPIPIAMLRGQILSSEATEKGTRFVLSVHEIEQHRQILPPDKTPKLVRLSLRNHTPQQMPKNGSEVEVLARLLPLSGPFYPGAYDFRRQGYYEGLGATGIAYRLPQVIDNTAQDTPLALWAENWRQQIAQRVHSLLPTQAGAVAIALMTGERSRIDSATNDAMRDAGIAHLLSISGMHIAMVAAAVFFAVRLSLSVILMLVALLPIGPRYNLAELWPLHKIAAATALIAITLYTFLVGAPIPAVRALLMAGLVLVAILINRRAITLRSVALAAGLILLIYPESLLLPGFQLSFAAITALVAAYEKWQQHEPATPPHKTTDRTGPLSWVRGYMLGLVLSSLIAGLATAPVGAWHFQRFQIWGILGNLVAVPLTSLPVMPCALLALLLMPFGLDEPFVQLMGWALEVMLQSAAMVASLPGANLVIGFFPLWVLLLMVLAGLWLLLWRSPLRWAGAPLMLLAIMLVPFTQIKPLALIGVEGQLAVRLTTHDPLYLAKGKADGLLGEVWARSFSGAIYSDSSPLICDKLGCTAALILADGANYKLALPTSPSALMEDCTKADLIVVAGMNLRGECEADLLDKKRLRQSGSLILLGNGKLIAAYDGLPRPWQPR
jgi:competence protein ComEC